MTSTSTLLGPDFTKTILDAVFKGIEEGSLLAIRLIWNTLTLFLAEYWLILMAIFFIMVVIATIKAMMGRWGFLGSVIYNSLYFGILLIIGLIWGPEVFVSDFLSVASTIILYPICYFVTGLILDKIGVK